MSEIYREASQVVVWLGEGDAATAHAFSLLANIGDLDTLSLENRPGRDFSVEAKHRMQGALHSRARQLLQEAGCASAESDKVGAIFRRSWFYRMWTIQEVIFASSNKIHVHCGDIAITWLKLVTAVDCLRAIKYAWGGWQNAMRVQSYLTQMMILHRFPSARELTKGNPANTLQHFDAGVLMVRCREKAASDPKDKALALYGLLSELGLPVPRPDYTKSIGDIYAETTAACIEYDKNLFSLYYVPSDTRRPGLPSWVPDWSDKGWDEGDTRYPVTRDRFAASGSSEPKWKISNDRRRLTVYGKIIDTVMYCASSYAMTAPPDIPDMVTRDMYGRLTVSEKLRGIHTIYRTFKEWIDVSSWAQTYPTGESVGDVVRRTLVNDEPRSVAESVHTFGDWFAAIQLREEQLTQGMHQRVPGRESSFPVGNGGGGLFARLAGRALSALERQRDVLERRAMGLVDGEELPIEVRVLLAFAKRPGWRYHSNAIPFSSNKIFFRTAGGFLGTAPDKIPEPIRSDDQIAVVAGLALPVILRPDGAGFRLVSHCYLHGVMYGEAWERVGGRLDEIVLV
ncbi:hypothetical protein OQA88_4648 [Cercophora sp. LCS_1]